MARQIIKQPDGLYAEYSTTVDQFVIWNATKEQIIEQRVKDAASDARQQCEELFAKLEAGEDPYYKLGMSWQEAIKEHNKRCKPDERIK